MSFIKAKFCKNKTKKKTIFFLSKKFDKKYLNVNKVNLYIFTFRYLDETANFTGKTSVTSAVISAQDTKSRPLKKQTIPLFKRNH